MIDLFVTDPPYNVDYQGGTAAKLKIQNDNMDEAEFSYFLKNAFSAAHSAMKGGCPFYVWTAQGHAQTDVAKALDQTELYFRQQLMWVKNSLVLGHSDYQQQHEPCLYGWKAGASHYFVPFRDKTTVHEDKIDIKKLSKAELQDLVKELLSDDTPSTVIHEDKPLRNDEHPTMKPVKLIGRLIKNSSKPGERVLDLFGGSGTTMIACEQLGRKCYMMELDPHYCDVILARWEKLTGKEAVKIQEHDAG